MNLLLKSGSFLPFVTRNLYCLPFYPGMLEMLGVTCTSDANPELEPRGLGKETIN